MQKQKIPDIEEIRKKFRKCVDFNTQIGLYETVEVNERYFIGDQWYGIKSNGMPTPSFNFLKQTTLFTVANVTSDNMAMQASILPSVVPYDNRYLEQVADIVTKQFEAIMEREKITAKCREYLRNAAVDGDGCIHVYFDPEAETGQTMKGEIKAEVIENTRVHFGNPNSRNVQDQPYIILTKRDTVENVRYRAEALHEDGLNDITDYDLITPDDDSFDNRYDSYTDDKVTVLTYYFRNRDTGTIWCVEATEKVIIQEAYDTEYSLYPVVWLNWDYKQNCYHGQALLTGLTMNQKVYNQMHAMIALHMSLQTFPKMVYDRTKISSWNGAPGMAIGVNGSVDGVAKPVSGAQLDPQVPAILEGYLSKTQDLQGASAAALGKVRPDNTSAIVALQRASGTVLELVKQDHYQSMEDLGRICIDIMGAKYGIRTVMTKVQIGEPGNQPLGLEIPPIDALAEFDFGILKDMQMAVKLDIGASSYWSEEAAMMTLDNLLMNRFITLKQYLERLPKGRIPKQEELIAEQATMTADPSGGMGTAMSMDTTSANIPVEGGSGNGSLQRALNREGA